MTREELEKREIITKYGEYDVRFLNELLSSGATKTGKIEKDEDNICHHKLRGKPYLQYEGREYSPAINCAKEIEEDKSVEPCECGGEYREHDDVLICDSCGALHPDYE